MTVCDITEWISRYNVAAQMMVHSMLDAGKLLADLYSKCPQLARGATVLTVYGEHVAAVKQLLCSHLCDVHEQSCCSALHILRLRCTGRFQILCGT